MISTAIVVIQLDCDDVDLCQEDTVLDSEILPDTASSSTSETMTTGNALDIARSKCDKPVQPTITFPSTTLVKRLVLFKRNGMNNIHGWSTQ